MKKPSKPKRIKRQPVVAQSAKLDHPNLATKPSQENGALLIIAQIFAAPPDLFNLNTSAKNCLSCTRQLLNEVPESVAFLDAFERNLIAACTGLDVDDNSDQPVAMSGRRCEYREWDLITRDLDAQPHEFILLVGVELARAYLLELSFSRTLAEKLLSLCGKSSLFVEELDWLTCQFIEKKKTVLTILRERSAGVTSAVARFNLQVTALLVAQQSTLRVEERQAAGRINELSEIELKATFSDLRTRVEENDAEAAIICIAFCLGLSYDISCGTAISHGSSASSIVSIDSADGTNRCDLNRALSRLAKTTPPGCIAATLVLIRPFPRFLANFLYGFCARNPLTQVVHELSTATKKSRKTLVVAPLANASLMITAARLVASRGKVFMRAGLQRDTAAYCSLSLSLLDASDHFYLVKSRQEIWQGCDTTFQHIGWGNAVRDPEVDGPTFGNKRTPEKQTVRNLVDKKKHDAETSRPGRKYKLDSLVRHHNVFVTYVALMLFLICGGRNRNIVNFKANAWLQPHGYGVHIDKPATPNQSRVPLAIPVTLAQQMVYLRTHYEVLGRRLKAKGLGDGHPARQRIAEVLSGADVELLFTLSKVCMPAPLQKTAVVDETLDGITVDFARHFIPNELPKYGVHFDYIQAWLRHHANGNSISADTKLVVPAAWLGVVANALDKVALELGLRPVHGISKG